MRTLGELRDFISKQSCDILPFGISEPFSWRGSYDEVAFSIIDGKTKKSEILKNIETALSDKFIGYKGGDFHYDTSTVFHFESDFSDWSDGGYVNGLLLNSLLKIK